MNLAANPTDETNNSQVHITTQIMRCHDKKKQKPLKKEELI